jgi:hypothetical protein
MGGANHPPRSQQQVPEVRYRGALERRADFGVLRRDAVVSHVSAVRPLGSRDNVASALPRRFGTRRWKNRILLENYYLPGNLEAQIGTRFQTRSGFPAWGVGTRWHAVCRSFPASTAPASGPRISISSSLLEKLR